MDSNTPQEVPISDPSQDFHSEHVEFLFLMTGIGEKKAFAIADFIERQNQKIAAIRDQKISALLIAQKSLTEKILELTSERDAYRKALQNLAEGMQMLFDARKEKGSTSAMKDNWNIVSGRLEEANKLMKKYTLPCN